MSFPPSLSRLCLAGVLCLSSGVLARADRLTGDLDDDGVITALDLARQIAIARGQIQATETDRAYADVNRDGVFNAYDSGLLVQNILGTRDPAALPLAGVLQTSPAAGDREVALTREFVLHFTLPLALDAVVTTHNPNAGTDGNLYAEFGGRRLLTRAELSSDRRKATLFFLEPLPASARVRVTFVSTGLNDILGRAVDGDGDGAAGGTATFDFDTLGITPLATVGVVGRVFGVPVGVSSATPVPLEGVTISVDGAEQTLRTTSGADGRFTLTPAPAGKFFVLIDGRTATGSGASGYYAFVGKAWEGVAGHLDTPATPATATTAAGDIYLPFIAAGTLQTVSATQPTEITFAPEVLAANPALAGVEITVPANSLFADSGARGGSVGIAPVAPDKLPEPLPEGLGFPLVITIQTDGAMNFDRPVPVRFPNLPDPSTGQPLPARSKSVLWSFNHDLGHWEMAGAMTVTADGRFVESDPGVGVRQPGWHGTNPFNDTPIDPPREDPRKRLDERRKQIEREQEPDCPELGGWEVAEAAFDASKEIAECLGNFYKVSKTLSCLLSLGGALRDVYTGLSSIADQLQADTPQISSIREAFSTLKDSYETIKESRAFSECREVVSPASKLAAAVDCLGNALGVAEAVCGLRGPEDQPDECKASPAVDFVCDTLGDVKATYDEAKELLEGLEDGENPALNALIDGLFESIDAALAEADEPAQPSSVTGRGAHAAHSLALTPEKLAELRTKMAQLRDALGRQYRATEAAGRVPIALQMLDDATRPVINVLNDLVASETEAFSGDYYYTIELIEEGDISFRYFRGKGTGGQQLRLRLPPDRQYRCHFFDPVNHRLAVTTGRTAPPGLPTPTPHRGNGGFQPDWRQRIEDAKLQWLHSLPPGVLEEIQGLTDLDSDQLPDFVEWVVGTNPSVVDTDGDGLSDAAELRAGSNPMDGRPVETGVVAAAAVTGRAVDLAVREDLAVTVQGQDGVTLFDVGDPLQPRRIAAVDTPGTARAADVETPYLAVADGDTGLVVIDISDAPAARITREIGFASSARSVAIASGIAYVGLENGRIAAVNLATGRTLGVATLLADTSVHDVIFAGDMLYAVSGDAVGAFAPNDGSPVRVDRYDASRAAGNFGRLRLTAGLGRLYQTYMQGSVVFDITDPADLVLRQVADTSQFGWRHLTPVNWSTALGAVDPNSTDDGAHDVWVYDLGADAIAPSFSQVLPTPGVASAVVAYDGFAYAADGEAGLAVINYLAPDTGSTAPTISLSGSFTLTPGSAAVEEAKRVRVTADARDDVLVRRVELLIDGAVTQVDGAFPFEFRFITPRIETGRTSFTLQVRAYDTGANIATTAPLTVALQPDSTPPVLVRSLPQAGSFLGTAPVGGQVLLFSEPLDLFSVSASSIQLRGAGPDGRFATADDLVLSGLGFDLDDSATNVTVRQSSSLPVGRYRLELSTGIRDLAGNALASAVAIRFDVLAFSDRDQDGVADAAEIALGLNPDASDSLGDGVPDGERDSDGDGLNNALEGALGTSPTLTDTNGDGVSDFDEDGDSDGLSNRLEFDEGTDPTDPDTDADGWLDEVELTTGSNPLDPASRPALFHAGTLPMQVTRPALAPTAGAQHRVVLPLQVTRPALAPAGAAPGGHIARPPVDVEWQ